MFGCIPNGGITLNSKMVQLLLNNFRDRFRKLTLALRIPEVLMFIVTEDPRFSIDNPTVQNEFWDPEEKKLKKADPDSVNFDVKTSHPIQNVDLFYCRNKITHSVGVVFVQTECASIYDKLDKLRDAA